MIFIAIAHPVVAPAPTVFGARGGGLSVGACAIATDYAAIVRAGGAGLSVGAKTVSARSRAIVRAVAVVLAALGADAVAAHGATIGGAVDAVFARIADLIATPEDAVARTAGRGFTRGATAVPTQGSGSVVLHGVDSTRVVAWVVG